MKKSTRYLLLVIAIMAGIPIFMNLGDYKVNKWLIASSYVALIVLILITTHLLEKKGRG